MLPFLFSLSLSRFNITTFLRHFFRFIHAGPQGFDDLGARLGGIYDFMDRVVGRKHFTHVHDAEVFFQDAQKKVVNLVVFAFLAGFVQFLVENGLNDGFRPGGCKLRGRPPVDEIRPHLAAAHHDV